MNCYIFHYHLRPGGVTGVIASSLAALDRGVSRIERLFIVTGEPPEAALREELSSFAGIINIPEIGYVSLSQLSEPPQAAIGPETRSQEEKERYRDEQVEKLLSKLRTRLIEECEGDQAFWWVHNHHLGKNPVFTEALLQLAQERPGLQVLLQIHDFPEDARYTNLRFLKLVLTRSPYPLLPNVRFATINSRDLALLREAGVPRELSFLLPNPLAPASGAPGVAAAGETASGVAAPAETASGVHPPATTSPASERRSVRQRLSAAYTRSFPLWEPEAPIALYPVRTIRRKNVMEAAFLLAALGRPVNLIVTLPGVSQQERNYSAMVEHAYQEGLIRGLWGIGRSLEEHGISFAELQGAADLYISSSVQEGFGFQYVDALRWEKPLIARDLPVLEDLRPLLPGAFFYRSVEVPMSTPSLSNVRPMLKLKYQERLDQVERTLPEPVLRRLEENLASLLDGETIDFSFLMPQMQYTFLKDLADDAFRGEVASLNPEVMRRLEEAVFSQRPVERQESLREVERRFGFEAYRRRIEGILASFDAAAARSAAAQPASAQPASGGGALGETPSSDTAHPPADGRDIQERLTAAFAGLDQLRLLFE